MWKFIVDVVHDFVSSLQPDVGRGFLHVSNVFLLNIGIDHDTVCAGVVGTAIRHSTSCVGRCAADCGRAGRHECCAE